MRDPMNWSFPIGHVFGVTVRVHAVLVLVYVGLIGRVAMIPEIPADAVYRFAAILAIMFVSVLLHEFGHVFAARRVDGDAEQILMWPLGGLAYCTLPHNPAAHFVTTAGGPLVNLVLATAAGAVLAAQGFWPPFSFTPPGLIYPEMARFDATIVTNESWAAVTAYRVFWINWMLFWFNLVPAFPMDGGRILQSVIWWRSDYRQGTTVACYVGFSFMMLFMAWAIVVNEWLIFFLAVFIYTSCKQHLIALETGGEESPFGYDFSQGYTSLEQDAPEPKRPRPNFIQRWLQKRAVKRAQHEIEQREAEERRMDELLDKIRTHGRESLSDEEKRFLQRVANRLRDQRS